MVPSLLLVSAPLCAGCFVEKRVTNVEALIRKGYRVRDEEYGDGLAADVVFDQDSAQLGHIPWATAWKAALRLRECSRTTFAELSHDFSTKRPRDHAFGLEGEQACKVGLTVQKWESRGVFGVFGRKELRLDHTGLGGIFDVFTGLLPLPLQHPATSELARQETSPSCCWSLRRSTRSPKVY